jgi:hypothetical protein
MLHLKEWPFEKVVKRKDTCCFVQSNEKMNVVVTVVVRGRQDARSGSGLPPFLAPPFASRQKVE